MNSLQRTHESLRDALPLTISGVRRLTGNLQVTEAADEISFDVEVP